MPLCGVRTVLALLSWGALLLWLDVQAGMRLPHSCVFLALGCPPDVAAQAELIEGEVADGFAPVRDAFAHLFAGGHDIGASFVAFVDGEKVVDIWAGRRFASEAEARQFETDFLPPPPTAAAASQEHQLGTGGFGAAGIHLAHTDEPWQEHSVSLMFSTTKGLAALAVGMLVDRGHLSWDDPVAKHWPEFAKHGKEHISVRHVLKHESGLLMPARPIGWDHIEDVATREKNYEDAVPRWTRESASRAGDTSESRREYQAVIFGDLVNAVFRRADPRGRFVGAFLREEVFAPLGLQQDFFMGLNDTGLDELFAPPHPMPQWDSFVRQLLPAVLDLDVRPLRERLAFRKLLSGDSTFHDPYVNVWNNTALGVRPATVDLMWKRRFVTTDQPAVNGIGNARAVASAYAAIAAGGKLGQVRLLKEETVRAMTALCHSEPKYDEVLNFATNFTDGGWGLLPPDYAPGRYFMGWGGYGGSFGGFNPAYRLDDNSTAQIAVAYIPNALGFGADWRAGSLVKALREAIGAKRKGAPSQASA